MEIEVPIIQHQLEKKRVIDEINQILVSHSVPERIDYGDLIFTENVATDAYRQNPCLSSAIVQHVWPSVSEKEVRHFTSRAAAISILSTRKLRLTSILKRFKEGEIETFCKDHNLDGYLEHDAHGDPIYKSLLMPNIFYASFTERYLLPDELQRMWDGFAAGDGVCITFKIRAKNPNFRRVKYQTEPLASISLLKQITDCVRSFENRRFVMGGTSRISAFYLGKKYSPEMEYRMLHRLWGEDLEKLPKEDELGNKYIEVPLGLDGAFGFEIDVLQVASREAFDATFHYPFVLQES